MFSLQALIHLVGTLSRNGSDLIGKYLDIVTTSRSFNSNSFPQYDLMDLNSLIFEALFF